jgi:hypothetical protein
MSLSSDEGGLALEYEGGAIVIGIGAGSHTDPSIGIPGTLILKAGEENKKRA